MKKALICVLVVCALLLCSCSATKQCEYDEAVGALEKSEEITVCIYSEIDDDAELEVGDLPVIRDGEALGEMLAGKWEKTSGVSLGDKIVSFTIDTQYEICLFEGGKAMIYYGFCGVFEKDRQYYNVELENSMEDIIKFANEKSEEMKPEDKK